LDFEFGLLLSSWENDIIIQLNRLFCQLSLYFYIFLLLHIFFLMNLLTTLKYLLTCKYILLLFWLLSLNSQFLPLKGNLSNIHELVLFSSSGILHVSSSAINHRIKVGRSVDFLVFPTTRLLVIWSIISVLTFHPEGVLGVSLWFALPLFQLSAILQSKILKLTFELRYQQTPIPDLTNSIIEGIKDYPPPLWCPIISLSHQLFFAFYPINFIRFLIIWILESVAVF